MNPVDRRSVRHRSVAPLLAAVAMFALPARGLASDLLDVYGRVNLTLQLADEAAGSQYELQNNASRVGVKGEQPLAPGLKAIYQLEWGVNIDGSAGVDTFTPRNQFVGLEGSFGTLKAGRHDTALKQSQGKFDLFDDLEGDISRILDGENRLTNYVGYVSPTFGKAFTATVNFFPGEDAANGEDGVADKASASLRYQAGAAYAAIAHDRDLEGEGVTTNRVVGGYTVGPARVMLLYQRTDDGTLEEDGVGASVAWTHGDYVAKVQYLTATIWKVRPQADPLDNRYDSLLSLGLDRRFGESTRIFGFFTTGDIGGTDERNTYAALGIEHNF